MLIKLPILSPYKPPCSNRFTDAVIMRWATFLTCVVLNLLLLGLFVNFYVLMLTCWRQLFPPKKQQTDPEPGANDLRPMVIDYVDEESLPPAMAKIEEAKPHSPLVYVNKIVNPGRASAQLKNTEARLRQAMEREVNNMNDEIIANPYGVPVGERKPDQENPLCDLHSRMKVIKWLNRTDVVAPIRRFLPERGLFSDSSVFNTCAIVSSAGSLHGSNLGQFIDSHDLVLRFNNAPTVGYENDVGSRTTVRILNSQILSNPQFDFLHSNLYKNVTLLMWDPAIYASTTEEWIKKPEHNFVDPYIKFRQKYPSSNFQLLDPSALWLLWDFIQSHTSMKIRRNPPSSGFLGIAVLLPYCSTVNVVEYVPTARTTQRCHYYSQKYDQLCTYGVWHPLAAEKLIALAMNTATAETVIYGGYVSIPGYDRLTC